VFLKIFYFVCLCEYYFLCFVFLFLCKKKKNCVNFVNFFYFFGLLSAFERIPVRSNVYTHCVQPRPNEFDRSTPHTHTSLHVYVRTYLRKFERMFHFTLMHPARVRSNVPMYVRMYLVLGLA
jgi:hypothetical protein